MRHTRVPELGCTATQLALAWVARNPNTSTVILGATKPEQLLENLKALELLPKLTHEVLIKIDEIVGNKPAPWVSALLRAAGPNYYGPSACSFSFSRVRAFCGGRTRC